MSLSEAEKRILDAAGSDPNPVARQRVVGIVRAKEGKDADKASKLLVQSFLTHVRPSFHLIPKGVESKVAEDGGTARDKAARIRTMTSAARERSFKACVLIDGKGWIERTAALLDVIIATEGRTYTLATLDHILKLPEIQSLLSRHDHSPP